MLNFHRGDQIAYIPSHAKGDIFHPSVQFGFFYAYHPSVDNEAYCRFWIKGTNGVLRTVCNSELTPLDSIVSYQSVLDEKVYEALRLIGNQVMPTED